MSAAPIIFRVRCHYCSKWRLPSEIARHPGNVIMCSHCYEWHCKALHTLATGQPPDGCQKCRLTFQQISDSTAESNVRMRIYVKDGIYQILCSRCGDAYEPKRLDLYGDTDYGHLKKLKGAK